MSVRKWGLGGDTRRDGAGSAERAGRAGSLLAVRAGRAGVVRPLQAPGGTGTAAACAGRAPRLGRTGRRRRDAATGGALRPRRPAGAAGSGRGGTAAAGLGAQLSGQRTNRPGAHGQGRYHQDAFTIDWDTGSVACPGGRTSTIWRDAESHRGTPVIRVRFPARHPTPCPACGECTKNRLGRQITLRPRAEDEAIHAARAAEQGEVWRRRYGHRNGVDATVSQGVRAFGLRSSRYRGMGKTHPQHLFTAPAMNLTRPDAWNRSIPEPALASHASKHCGPPPDDDGTHARPHFPTVSSRRGHRHVTDAGPSEHPAAAPRTTTPTPPSGTQPNRTPASPTLSFDT